MTLAPVSCDTVLVAIMHGCWPWTAPLPPAGRLAIYPGLIKSV